MELRLGGGGGGVGGSVNNVLSFGVKERRDTIEQSTEPPEKCDMCTVSCMSSVMKKRDRRS